MSGINNINKNNNNKKVISNHSNTNNSNNKSSLNQNQAKSLQQNQQIIQQQQQIHQQVQINQGKKIQNVESPKFLKYFFKDCQNQEKMSTLVESQKRQIEEENNQNSCNRVLGIDNEQNISNEFQLHKQLNIHKNINSSGLSNNTYNNTHNANQIKNPLDFSKYFGQFFNTPIIPHIPPEFQTKTPSFDVTELIECLAELKPANIISGKKKNSSSHINTINGANGCEWNVNEQDVQNLIKKYSTEGYKTLLMQDYKQALLCLKKSEILMNAFVAKDGKIESEILLFIKANLGICFYRIGLLQEAYSNFCICLAFLKKQNMKQNNNIKSNMQFISNSNQNIISNQYKKRSYSNLPNIDQVEYLQMIAQKLKKKKLKGDLLLQACIVLSEQGKHEEALIVGNKASKLQLNYIIDTLTACYHLILQMIKERDQTSNNAEGLLSKTQTSRRGNSAHQSGTSSTNHTNYFSQQQNKDIKNSNISYNIFDGDFVQELQPQLQPQSQGLFKNVDLKEKISYQEKLIPILKEVMKRTNDLHASFVNPSKIKILEVMNKIINNSNLISNNLTNSSGQQLLSKGIKSVQSPSSSSSSFKHTDRDNQITGDNNWSFEVSLYERPDLEFLFKTITSSSHWILKTNILSLLQLKGISFDDTQINKVTLEQEICIDSILNKLSHLCVSFYCISTETRFINDQKKNKLKENPILSNQQTSPQNQLLSNQSKYAKFLQNLNYEVSESENWLSRSLEIAYVFLPHDMPLVGQIVSVHNKFHNVNKIVIKEDDNEHIEDDEESLYEQSYDQEYNSHSNKENTCQKDQLNSNNIYNSEYASPLVTLPGGSKSNFFIPLVRKIKPQITQYPVPKDELEEEINKLYNSYTSSFVQNTPEYTTTVESNSSTTQLFVNNSKAEKFDASRQKQSQSQSFSSNQAFEKQLQKPLKEKLLSTNTQNINNNNTINNKNNNFNINDLKKQGQDNQQAGLNDNQIIQTNQNQDFKVVQKESFNTLKNQTQNLTKKQEDQDKKNFLEDNVNKNNKSNPKINPTSQQIIHKLSSTTPAELMQIQQIQQQLHQQQLSQKYIQQNQFQSTVEQNIQRISKTADFSQQLQKQLQDDYDEYEEFEDQDEYNLDEFQIMNSNPQIFLQNTQQNQQQNAIQQQNQQLKNSINTPITSNNNSNYNSYQSNLVDSKYDQIRKSQERKLKDKHYQQYQQLMQQRNQNVEKRQHSQENNQRSKSNGSNTQQPVQSQINNQKQYQHAFNSSNVLLFNSNNPNIQIQNLNNQQENVTNSGQKKKKRVLSLAQDTSSSFSQQSLQQGLCSPQYVQQIQQQDIQYINGNPEQSILLQQLQNQQQKQLKKIISKPLSAERKYRTIDNSLNSIKNLSNNNNFINNVNVLLEAGNYPQSAKNSASNTGNQSSARQQIQQISQTFEIKRKSSTGNAPSSKTARSNSLNKTTKSNSNNSNNQQKNVYPLSTSTPSSTTVNSFINNSSLINQSQNAQKSHSNNNQSTNDKKQQKLLKNNYISEHILNEIFDINNVIKPTHNRVQSMQVQSSSQSFAQQNPQQYLQQQYLQNNSPQIQQQLINHLTNNNNSNSKRLNSKENVQRSNCSNKSVQRKNKKNLDIQVNQQMIQFNNINEDIDISKSSRNQSIPSNFLQDNYMSIFKGSQSTKSSQNQNIYQNQQFHTNKQNCKSTTNNQNESIGMINNSMNNIMYASMLSKNQTPKNSSIPSSVGSSQNPSSASNDKKLHMLRKFRSTVGKVPEDLLKKK